MKIPATGAATVEADGKKVNLTNLDKPFWPELGEVALTNPRYRNPLETHARALDEAAGPGTCYVLLGSIASDKYVNVLTRILGERLLFPTDFVGRGDMSRGGLMLRAASWRPARMHEPDGDLGWRRQTACGTSRRRRGRAV